MQYLKSVELTRDLKLVSNSPGELSMDVATVAISSSLACMWYTARAPNTRVINVTSDQIMHFAFVVCFLIKLTQRAES